MPNFGELTQLFDEVRKLVSLPENDFSWSSWLDKDHALLEIDGIRNQLLDAKLPVDANVLFLPTGPIQELALSSGWGDTFIRLADWYDDAVAGRDCECYETPLGTEGEPLGMDKRYGEISVVRCPKCDRNWLSYRYELESFTRSGRWFLGPISKPVAERVTAETARDVFESLPWYFAGGSYFGSISKVSGPLAI